MVTNKKKNIQYYLQLPWTYTIETAKDQDKPYYIIHVNELPGISTDALTIAEGMEAIKEAMIATFELYIKHGEIVPEPIDEKQFKGNIAYRTTSRRHYLLAREATRRSKSLNQLIDEYIDTRLERK